MTKSTHADIGESKIKEIPQELTLSTATLIPNSRPITGEDNKRIKAARRKKPEEPKKPENPVEPKKEKGNKKK